MEENDRAGYGAAASTALALGEGLANAAGAFTGVNGIIEGVSGQELWTGNQLSTMDRWTRGLGGVGTLLTAGVGVGELADVAQEGLRVFSCGVPEAFADDGLAGAADRMLENAGDFVSGSGVNCFTAGTQVVVGLVVVGNDGAQQEIRSQLELDLATSPAGGVATAVKVCGYLTKAIETIESGQCLVSRDEDDASAPLVFRRIEDRFGNTAYGLIHVTLLSSGGIQHTISTTVEHPIFVPGRGWIRVSELSAGDALEDICGLSTVLACQTATQLSGVGVFNLRVNRSRTYFVREPHCNAEPLWVHNTCGGSVPPTAVDGEGAGIAVSVPPNTGATLFRNWNDFQAGTAGQFASRAEVAAGWAAYKDANGIVTGTVRSQAARSQFLRSLADDYRTPSWQKPWLQEGRSPPGYEVDHITPLSIGGPDTPANMRLQGADLHDIHHLFYHPWR
jgi:hypothetical protein